MPDLRDRIALVTGGGRGIGRAIATKLAEYGAEVGVTDTSAASATAVADSLNLAGGKHRSYELDVTDWVAAHNVVNRVEAEMGPIDILVNNAGLSRFVAFLDLDEAEWDRVLDVNLKGTFVVCRAVLPRMVERQRGRVVNLASILGKMGEPNFAHYAASKFGVVGLSQSLAAEMAQHDITVNTVCPGIVDTPMWTDLYSEAIDGIDAWNTTDEVRDWVTARIPLGRRQTPEDIAEMVAFLSSDMARNVTGSSYHVDGGMVPR